MELSVSLSGNFQSVHCVKSFCVSHLVDIFHPQIIRFSSSLQTYKDKMGLRSILAYVNISFNLSSCISLKLTPVFPKYVCVANLVLLICNLPASNLTSTHLASLSATGYSMSHSSRFFKSDAFNVPNFSSSWIRTG